VVEDVVKQAFCDLGGFESLPLRQKIKPPLRGFLFSAEGEEAAGFEAS